jgi:hypothetical protein
MLSGEAEFGGGGLNVTHLAQTLRTVSLCIGPSVSFCGGPRDLQSRNVIDRVAVNRAIARRSLIYG